MNPPEGAFFSYVHADDEHEAGRLTLLRERLESEIAYQLGRKFSVWQDRKDIGWGQQWKQRIAKGVKGALFFIPMITPRWFESAACREEMELFLKREKTLKREDLVLPIIYQQCDALTDERLKKADPLAETILSHQWIDLVPLRFKPFDGADVREKIADMARQLIISVKQGAPAAKAKSRSGGKKRARTSITEGSAKSGTEAATTGRVRRKLAARTEPLTLIVDQMPGRGVSTTISDAIRNAPAGTRIVIRPGIYREALVLEKPLELIGEESTKGQRVVVETANADCLLFRTNFGRVENVDFRQVGGGEFYGLDIGQGQLVLEDCRVTSQSLSCVGIHHGADPILRRNSISDGNESGVIVYEEGKGTLESNDIFGNALAGVAISDGSDPILRGNRIHDGKKGGGVYVFNNGKGTLENNDIFGNALAGVELKDGADAILRANRIHDGKLSGVLIHANAKGTLENNDIISNGASGIVVGNHGQPTVHGNRIKGNQGYGIRVNLNGRGLFEGNELNANQKGNWLIAPEAEKNVRRLKNRET